MSLKVMPLNILQNEAILRRKTQRTVYISTSLIQWRSGLLYAVITKFCYLSVHEYSYETLTHMLMFRFCWSTWHVLNFRRSPVSRRRFVIVWKLILYFRLSNSWYLQRINPLLGIWKPQRNGPLYSNTVIGTVAVDWWAVTFGTARRGPGWLQPRQVPS